MRSMSDQGRTRVTELQTRYGLKNSVGDDRRNAITLSRVAMAFPWLPCGYSQESENPVVTDDYMQQYVPGYPRQILHPAFSAMIPRTLPAASIEVLLGAFLLYQCKFASIVTKKPGQAAKRPSECETFTRQFAVVSMSKAYIPDQERAQRLINYGIMNAAGLLNNAVIQANNRYLMDRGDGPLPIKNPLPAQNPAQGGGGPLPPGGGNPSQPPPAGPGYQALAAAAPLNPVSERANTPPLP